MEKLTKEKIEEMANEIVNELKKRGYGDTRVYFNNKAIDVDYDGTIELIENINPHDYFEYAAYEHILSMSFEGTLYESINYGSGAPWLSQIFTKYGVYYELGEAWNLTTAPLNDNMEVEYTVYNRPKKRKYIYMGAEGIPYDIRQVMYKWYAESKAYGDKGSCVIGAGFNFTYEGEDYKLAPCSPWQGNLSWEHCLKEVRGELEVIGCTNIYYDYGRLD